MSQAFAEGVCEVAGCEAVIRRVQETLPNDWQEAENQYVVKAYVNPKSVLG
jgi:hypothetical protein